VHSTSVDNVCRCHFSRSHPPLIDGRLYYVSENLENLDAFKGLSISRESNNGRITPAQDLFRTDWPGVSSGPVVSQFMLADFDIDGIVVPPKQKTLVPGVEYMTAVDTWLDVQVRLGSRCDLHVFSCQAGTLLTRVERLSGRDSSFPKGFFISVPECSALVSRGPQRLCSRYLMS